MKDKISDITLHPFNHCKRLCKYSIYNPNKITKYLANYNLNNIKYTKYIIPYNIFIKNFFRLFNYMKFWYINNSSVINTQIMLRLGFINKDLFHIYMRYVSKKKIIKYFIINDIYHNKYIIYDKIKNLMNNYITTVNGYKIMYEKTNYKLYLFVIEKNINLIRMEINYFTKKYNSICESKIKLPSYMF